MRWRAASSARRLPPKRSSRGRCIELESLPLALPPLIFDPFVADMQKYGWTQGGNYTLESRFTEGYYQRASALAAELVGDPSTSCSPSIPRMLRDASGVIPIVTVTKWLSR